MDEQQTTRASVIFQKPSAEWSKDDWAFLDKVIKQGFRSRLKQLRQEVQDEMQTQA
jgi:hypothetical protein